MSMDADEINRKMHGVAKELSSKYAVYPLKGEAWLSAAAMVDDDTPAFIAKGKDPNFPTQIMKDDYVWGTGPKGYGYYHLTTRYAYKILHNRLENGKSAGCCCFGTKGGDSTYDDDVMDVIYYRSVASKPNDFTAYQDAIELARDEANTHYNVSQDVQLFLMIAT